MEQDPSRHAGAAAEARVAAFYRTLVENAMDAMIIIQDGRTVYRNPIYAELIGYSVEETAGMTFLDFVAPEQREAVAENYRRRLRGEPAPAQYEVDLIARSGERLAMEVKPSVIDYLGRPATMVLMRDIRERRRAEADLRRQAEELARLNGELSVTLEELAHSQAELQEKSRLLEEALGAERERSRRDGLTGVLNHAAIVEALTDLVHTGGPARTAVVMVDVDNLKAINDAHGHQAGDQVLCAIASALAAEEATVGRYGGDEFVVLLPGARRGDAEAYCRLMRARLGRAAILDAANGEVVPVEASIGIALYPEDASTIADLIGSADAEMYGVKRERPRGRRRLSAA
jgi:diguanylate cyclase (GGDEF)-like protein/PAS domain S-box-containing protein